jgi:hypothetical protein
MTGNRQPATGNRQPGIGIRESELGLGVEGSANTHTGIVEESRSAMHTVIWSAR